MNSEDKRKMQRSVQLDHNYSIAPSGENITESLLEVKRSVPFHQIKC